MCKYLWESIVSEEDYFLQAIHKLEEELISNTNIGKRVRKIKWKKLIMIKK